MGTTTTRPTPGEGAVPPYSVLLRRSIRQLGYIAGLIVALLGLLTALSAIAIVIQAQRDDTRQADALLVIAPEHPPIALVEHSFELFRRGYGHRVLLVGAGGPQLRADLAGRGVPIEAIIVAKPDDSVVAQMHELLPAAADHVLLVCEPSGQLLGLKVARDLDVEAYGSPAGALPDPLAVLHATGEYWAYLLLR